jgi:hypothetical protein
MDWMVHTLDHITKEETGVGNVSQVVLEILGRLDAEKLKNSLSQFLALNPIASGHCRRDWNLAPYWHIPAKTAMADFNLNSFEVDRQKDACAVFEILTREVNRPFESRRQHLAFNIVYHGGKTYFAMQFDHHLLDARGAEMFLSEFNSFVNSGRSNISGKHSAPAQLDRWKENFDAGRQANRMFLSLGEEGPPAAVPLPEDRTKRKSAYAFKSYSSKTFRMISKLADEKAGYLMMMPYLLGCTVHCIHKTLCNKGIKSGPYVVPVNLDARSRKAGTNQLFFNHVAFLYFKFSPAEACNSCLLWEQARRQLYDSTKSRISENIAKASMLMRILPAGVLWKLMRSLFKGSAMSFSFSYIGKEGYEDNLFLSGELINIDQMPRVPTPPGLGIFFTVCKGQLNVVLSFLEGMLSPEEASSIMSALDSALTSGDADG